MQTSEYHYSMIIQWEPQGGVYVVTVPELEGTVTHGVTYEAAVANGQEAIQVAIAAAHQMGEELPAPHSYDLGEVIA